MKIRQLTDYSLDRYEIPADAESDIAKAANLLHELLNSSYQCSGNCLETDYHDKTESVQSLYWKCKELLGNIAKTNGKADFLSMSVIEQTWNMAKPLILCSLPLLMEPDGLKPIEDAKELERILSNNVYKLAWKERSAAYTAILKRMGFNPDATDFTDLTNIMDPLLSALSVYNTEKAPEILQIRSGKPSEKYGQPVILNSISIYGSQKEITDAAMDTTNDKLIFFAALSMTHRQTKDYFYEWLKGFPEERQRNVMHYDHISEEEYLNREYEYSRMVYLCVRNGENLYLQPMKWLGDTYGGIGTENGQYYYGKRASYAPYQVFMKQAAPGKDGTTDLAVPQNSYALTEILDAMSIAWLPAFLDETIKYYFKAPVQDTKPMILPEEAMLLLPGAGQSQTAVVPVVTGLPAICTYQQQVLKPDDIFEEDWMKTLIQYTGVTSKDIQSAPLIPIKMGSREDFDKQIRRNTKQAYAKAIAGHIIRILDTRWDAREWAYYKGCQDKSRIIQDAVNGRFQSFMTQTINGEPVMDKDGNPVMEKENRYPYALKQKINITEIYDSKDQSEPRNNVSHMVFWNGPSMNGRPAVVWKIHPANAEDYAALLDTNISSLPEPMRLSGPISKFYDAYKDILPDSMTNKYVGMGYGQSSRDDKKSIYLPCLLPINICMTKRTYKAILKEKEAKKKGK